MSLNIKYIMTKSSDARNWAKPTEVVLWYTGSAPKVTAFVK